MQENFFLSDKLFLEERTNSHIFLYHRSSMENITIIKRGRPTKYTQTLPSRVMHYTDKCIKNGDFPTIEGLALELGVSARILYGWDTEYSDFFQTMETLRNAQKHMLQADGLSGKYNARMATFLLKETHGITDATPPIHATQNNYMNISPELLAEALKIMEENS
jgi:hypothetical protein